MKSKPGRRLVVEELEETNPVKLFGCLADRPYSFFLDSSLPGGKMGRYSFMGADPFLVFKSKGDAVEIRRGDKVDRMHESPLDLLKKLLDEHRLEDSAMHFAGGAVGYLSYDLWGTIYHIKTARRDELDMPDIHLGFYDTAIIFDCARSQAFIVSDSDEKAARLENSLEENCEEEEPEAGWALLGELESNFTKEGYFEAVKKIREYIAAGDVYQINLSQRYSGKISGNLFAMYRRLRDINPAPYSAFLNFGGETILSSSPERFLMVEGRRIETNPIKGTRPRGRNALEDVEMRRELSESEKDKAEHLMIVDLERNDLGRICKYGSVRVRDFQAIEEYATVYHMVSAVEGTLRDGVGQMDCIKACFPGGSITGAPKVRAMEIIGELEPDKRGLYTGSIGYLSFNGNMNLSIVIRTLVIKDGIVHLQVGGGVVADSTPESEYDETLDKAKALVQAVKDE